MKNAAAVLVKPALRERFASVYPHCRVILFSAPCGSGKTTVALELLRGRRKTVRSAADGDLFEKPIPRECAAVVIDDLQMLQDQEDQQRLCAMIRDNPEKKFLLLSRGANPGYLMPFQFAGVMEVFEISYFMLDLDSVARFLEKNDIRTEPGELAAIQRDMRGFPAPLSILCRQMQNGRRYDETVLEDVKRELFVYFDTAVYRRFDRSMARLLLDLAPFEQITAELARLVSGDAHAGELLRRLQLETTMLVYDSVDTYHIYPIFREFLNWEAAQLCTPEERRAAFSRAGLYYELAGDYPQALSCYEQGGDHTRMSELLEKHAQLHPGVAHFYETEVYYRALPEEEIRRSPSLMCAMSMICAITMDFEGSERWYRALQDWTAGKKRSDSAYREARGKLAYLDIALPQRGSRGLIELIGGVFRVMSDHQLSVPSFSVTSTLPSIMNGGKDFCDWSKQDDLLYVTMRKAVETVLGRDGIGLADCAICESKLEKGEDVSGRLLSLLARLGEIQQKGTPDIEFAVVGLLARNQVLRGEARTAREAVLALRDRFEQAGETRFFANIDAMLCRIDLRTGATGRAEAWRRDKGPKDRLRLRAMWRYQYLTLAMTELAAGDCSSALLTLTPLLPYCEICGRKMDLIDTKLLMAMAHRRLGEETWRGEFAAALTAAQEYRFVTPVAKYGAAVLPLLTECGWKEDEAWLETLISAARAQAVLYPEFLREQGGALPEPLTSSETQVLRLICHDMSNQEIGNLLGIQLPTVKSHVSHILQKLGVSRRSEAKAAAERLRLVERRDLDG